jgi:hypothetical protein
MEKEIGHDYNSRPCQAASGRDRERERGVHGWFFWHHRVKGDG